MDHNFRYEMPSVQEEKSMPLAERVAEQINRYIVEKNLQPDEKLPNEFELADTLNVSRGTIREAIKLLASRNVVEIRRGKGTFICKQTGTIEDPLGLAYLQDKARLARELLEIRQHMEPWIAAEAAVNATEDDLDCLRRACAEVEEKIQRKENHLQADKAFHTCIAECTHNRIIPKLVPIILYSVDMFGSLYLEKDDTEALLSAQEMTMKTHRHILKAIETHDPDYARMSSYEHLIGNREQVEMLEKKSNP